MADQNDSGNSIVQLKSVARDLYSSLQQMGENCADEEQKAQIEQTMAKSRELFLQMKNFITTVLKDLEGSREQLNQNSEQVFGNVSKQLDKVNESTQDAVQSVLDRVDNICERQNDVFERLGEMKGKLKDIAEDREQNCEPLVELADKIEAIEGEIQVEAFEIMNEMQFQDITSQQLQQANQLLVEAKGKLTNFHNVLSVFRLGASSMEDGDADKKGGPRTFDPSATMKDREKRQQVADEIETGYSDSEED